jgi:hypothetical protein
MLKRIAPLTPVSDTLTVDPHSLFTDDVRFGLSRPSERVSWTEAMLPPPSFFLSARQEPHMLNLCPPVTEPLPIMMLHDVLTGNEHD